MTLKNHALMCEIGDLIEQRREAQEQGNLEVVELVDRLIEEKSQPLRVEDPAQRELREQPFLTESIIYALNHGYSVSRIHNEFHVSDRRIKKTIARMKEGAAE
ncbi:hypothetical protein OYT88_04695 [Sporolactobacillus sp. CQH2019]|uniref:hypothetical protein n=1 Tax=Sporolactobacillus sp. CQH2019 TaxID=3023512 RepID=UPI0023684A1B|nr:hypothetical protein [Sporolactobacillus sp. CQH2019]MDD9147847.1 hypothetical protein [Sporolactobacillus sp. CQH2019]